MEKIFIEHPWEDDDRSSVNEFNFKFVKEKVSKASVSKRANKLQNSTPGRFVRAPSEDVQETPNKIQPSNRKRKATQPTKSLHDEAGHAKQKKQKEVANVGQPKPSDKQLNGKGTASSKEVSLREKLVESLKGSRFRFLNEQLYKSTGEVSRKMFLEDPEAFRAYHDGYRHQIAQWCVNPLDRIIKSIQKLPKNFVIADFGCGEARLAEEVPHKVYSLDLVAANKGVIACDMAQTPLETNSTNVVVFCLSLMGTNLRDFLLEANRIMKVGALLKIAEVSSRFDNVKEFIDCVHKCGFLLDSKDLKHKLFYFFNFKKVRTVDKQSLKGKHFSLKPCLYKKR
ncbi:ribosomal RNA-processing protein 8 [Sabethes cyaneus]|uniref:ribosomal RNA-processing protein 8 n=1 Tax=Sabethes cyaneus TaxID=53552 RepID=UPI00237E3F22|nr:ribosomal RNA-processing protein 8 [Sabethes cyaneus]